jgi:hypothetical protein
VTLYTHSPKRLHGVLLSYLSTGTTVSYMLLRGDRIENYFGSVQNRMPAITFTVPSLSQSEIPKPKLNSVALVGKLTVPTE